MHTVNILQPGCGVGGIVRSGSFFIVVFTVIKINEINNFPIWCIEKIKLIQKDFELNNGRKLDGYMGLSFKPNIDDLRQSPAKFISEFLKKSIVNQI